MSTPKNYKISTKNNYELHIKFLNDQVMSTVIRELCCKLHNCGINDIVCAFSNQNEVNYAQSDVKNNSDSDSEDESLSIPDETNQNSDKKLTILAQSPSVKEINKIPELKIQESDPKKIETESISQSIDESIEMMSASKLPKQISPSKIEMFQPILHKRNDSIKLINYETLQSHQLATSYTPKYNKTVKIENDLRLSKNLIDECKLIDNVFMTHTESEPKGKMPKSTRNIMSGPLYGSQIKENDQKKYKQSSVKGHYKAKSHQFQTFESSNYNFEGGNYNISMNHPVLSTQTIVTINQNTRYAQPPFQYVSNAGNEYELNLSSSPHKSEDLPILTQT